MSSGEDLSAVQALEEIARVRERVRRSGRWVGGLYLFWGVSAVGYWMAMFFGPPPVQRGAAIFWVLLTAGSFFFIYRQGVHGYGVDRDFINKVSVGWVVSMVGTALAGIFLLPDDPTGWWVAVAVVLSALAALPMLYGGWRMRPWAADR
ncbi:hypothetical protein [Sphaerisporangium aureirubrum]|uniref:Uncharacterized protein n=1 Tax=Sphaerisporangium aureirubrum TaxID=1544736 RepID=A0ABW1NTH8_9ACTN